MPAVIFSGNNVKALKSSLQLGENSVITSGALDPSSVATAGVAGDVYISTSTKLIYIKQDGGTTTNWTTPIFSDGANFNYNTGTQTLTIANLTVNGTTTNIDTTNVNVADKLVILNKGGAAASGSNVGFEVEENGIITGYIQTSADRNSWLLKAPNTSGVATITPGTGGIDLIGTGNGLRQAGNFEVDNATGSNVAFTVKGALSNAPADLMFDATYTNGSSLDATYVFSGSAVPVATNASPVVTANALDLTANTGQWVRYDGTCMSTAVQQGTIRFRYTPNYTGNPPSVMRPFCSGTGAMDGNSNNRILFTHASTTDFEVDMWDAAGGTSFSITAPYSPTAGVTTEWEFNWDVTSGIVRLFQDGVQVGVTAGTTTLTRDTSTDHILLGTFNDLSTPDSDFSITDIVVYKTVRHTSNFSSPIAPLLGPFSAPQSANLFEWKNGSGTVLSFVDNAGFITLPGNPTTNLMAATKQYVDTEFAAETLTQVLTNGNNAGALNITNLAVLADGSNINAIDIPNRILYDQAAIAALNYASRNLLGTDGTTVKLNWSGADLSVNTHKITNVVDPTAAQDAATKNYVDNRVRVFTSTPTVGGAALEAVTVTGLLATDTILSVSQMTGGAGVLPILGFTTHSNNLLTCYWSADPGPGAVVIVGVLR